MITEKGHPNEEYADWKAPKTGELNHLHLVKEGETGKNPLDGMSNDDIDAALEINLDAAIDDEDQHQSAVFQTRLLQEQYKKEGRTFGKPNEDDKKTA